MTREERVAELKEKHQGHYDYALPQPWAEKVLKRTDVWPCGHFVWLYDEVARIFGRPYPMDEVGDRLINQAPDLFFPTVEVRL
jgi:hypothetical protein